MPAFPSGAVAALSLLVGYGAVDVTGQRALGGVVLLAGAVVCAWLWQRAAGTRTAAVLLLAYAAAFVGSHLLADLIGAWPAVLVVSAAMAALAWFLVDRRVVGREARSAPTASGRRAAPP